MPTRSGKAFEGEECWGGRGRGAEMCERAKGQKYKYSLKEFAIQSKGATLNVDIQSGEAMYLFPADTQLLGEAMPEEGI